MAGASDCDIAQLSAENRSEYSDLCVSTPRAWTTTASILSWRMLIGLPRSSSSKSHNCLHWHQGFKNPRADPRSAFLRSDISLAVATDSKMKRRCLLVLVLGAC
ncbi:hypothetical protein TSAR_010950 [Trichomalopsis sarcophagae]|uniref:Uncharacterized protein n=1 Tax=Trichomalopsis sarcophagae TaxID=543379 RepID=A0A232FDW4_9HYME|nr:hypothetical protein TSAR_010950 [Trichomalopsis sarcophagae]